MKRVLISIATPRDERIEIFIATNLGDRLPLIRKTDRKGSNESFKRDTIIYCVSLLICFVVEVDSCSELLSNEPVGNVSLTA